MFISFLSSAEGKKSQWELTNAHPALAGSSVWSTRVIYIQSRSDNYSYEEIFLKDIQRNITENIL